MESLARGEFVVRYPDFPEPIDWAYVDDAAEVLLRAIEYPSAADCSGRVAERKGVELAGLRLCEQAVRRTIGQVIARSMQKMER